jgi:hypothetical protein
MQRVTSFGCEICQILNFNDMPEVMKGTDHAEQQLWDIRKTTLSW